MASFWSVRSPRKFRTTRSMRPQLARRPRRARPRRRCSMRSRARPPPRCSNRRAWSGRDRSSANCRQMITVKALFFDVFGTLVDFRTGVAREAETILARARRNNVPWAAILGAEIARDYKRKPRVYLAACEAFDLPPGDCMMVAAQSDDLQAAAKCGLRTAHVARPNERGPGIGEVAPTVPVDVAASNLEDLAAKLGA